MLVIGAAPAPDSWRALLLRALLGCFANATRPAVSFMTHDVMEDVQCGASLVGVVDATHAQTLLRAAGETDSPIPDVLGGDLLRAAAYKQAGLAPQRASRLTVQLLLADSRLLNQKAVVERLTRALSSVRLAGARKA